MEESHEDSSEAGPPRCSRRRPMCRRARPWRRKSSPSGGSRASTSPRTTRCSPRSRNSRTRPGVKVELSQYPGAGHDSRRRSPRSMPARRRTSRYADVYDFQVTGQVGVRRQARGHHRTSSRRSKDKFLKNTIETTYLYNDKTKKKAYYAIPDEAADDAHPVLEGHAGARRVTRNPTSRPRWKAYWDFWCDKVQPAHRTQDRQAHLRDRPADGRRFERLVLLVPDVHGRLQRQAGRRQRQAAGRRPEGRGRA